MTAPDLSKQAFRAWLESLSPGRIVGNKLDGYSCPLAQYVRDVVPEPDNSFVSAGYMYIRTMTSDTMTPNWASAFMDRVDHHRYTSIRQSTALRILDEIEIDD